MKPLAITAPAITVAATDPARRAPGALWRVLSNSQAPNPMSTIPARAAATTSAPVCCASTQTSQTAVPYIGKARTCFRCSIHGPGFGRKRSKGGQAVSSR